MHSAASQPEEPAPEREALEAKAHQVWDDDLAVNAEIRDALALLPAAACDPELCARLVTRLQNLATATWDRCQHVEENRAELARFVVAVAAADAGYRAGWADALKAAAEQDIPKVPRQRHRHAAGGWTQSPLLRRIKVVAFIAVLGSGLRYAFRAHRIAAALTAVTLPVAVGAGTYVALQPGTASSLPAASAPNPAASIYAATPAPSSSLAGSVRHAKKAAKGGGKRLLNGSGVPVSWISTNSPQQSSSPASSSSAPSVQASVSVGPATLTVSAASLDLSNPLDPTTTFSITASGGGWASWRISTAGVDLDFSQDHGVLQSGQVAWVTVTVAAGQAADGNTSQVFSVTVQGVTIQSVTVALPALVASVLPSPVVSASVIPSGL